MSEPTSRELLAKVEAARARVMDGGRPEAVAKRRQHNMATARERIATLVDPGSFREFGALVEPERKNELNRDLVAPADGFITGGGAIAGREICLGVQDYTVHGGSSGSVARHKFERLMQRANDRGLPLVMLLEGGGHRIQDGMNSAHFAAAAAIFQDMGALSGWVPVVATMMGQGFAGPTNYTALADFVVMVRGMATMGMAGPALVKAGTGRDISKEDLAPIIHQAPLMSNWHG